MRQNELEEKQPWEPSFNVDEIISSLEKPITSQAYDLFCQFLEDCLSNFDNNSSTEDDNWNSAFIHQRKAKYTELCSSFSFQPNFLVFTLFDSLSESLLSSNTHCDYTADASYSNKLSAPSNASARLSSDSKHANASPSALHISQSGNCLNSSGAHIMACNDDGLINVFLPGNDKKVFTNRFEDVNFIIFLIAFLPFASRIKSLILPFNHINRLGGIALSYFLLFCSSLQEINLNQNELCPISSRVVLEALNARCPHIQILDVGNNEVGRFGAIPVLSLLDGGVTGSVQLKILVLDNTQIDIDIILHLTQVLRSKLTHSLCVLSLNNLLLPGEEFYEKALEKIGGLFCSAKNEFVLDNLTELHLMHCGISDFTLSHLLNGLYNNNHLRTLNLAGNKIDEHGCELLSRLLISNNRIETLMLASNNIKNKGASKLAHALKYNQKLRRLDLSNCSIESQGLIDLASALYKNQSIQFIAVKNNVFNSTAAHAWNVLLEQHAYSHNAERENPLEEQAEGEKHTSKEPSSYSKQTGQRIAGLETDIQIYKVDGEYFTAIRN